MQEQVLKIKTCQPESCKLGTAKYFLTQSKRQTIGQENCV